MGIKIPRRRIIFVISSPSGTGKTSLCQHLLRCDQDLVFSVSTTTRPPRSQESHGKDYFFTTHQDFQEGIEHHHFLEYARVFDHFYGTSQLFIDQCLSQEKDVLCDIEWEGAQKILAKKPKDTVCIFLLPPSFASLYQRLQKRHPQEKDLVQKRLFSCEQDIHQWPHYDYVLINDVFLNTAHHLQAIIQAERFKRARQHLGPFVEAFDFSCTTTNQ